MPRGFKVDRAATGTRFFQDSRSFIAIGGCEVLYGEDVGKRRRELYDRAHGRCELQSSPRCRGFVNWNDEWHHLKTHGGKKCDCLTAGKFVCGPCHRFEHRARNPRWTPRMAT